MERYKTNIHGLEDLILLGCQYSQNWPTFSMKPLLKFLFCRKGKADPKICMKLQGAVNSQKKVLLEEQSRRTFKKNNLLLEKED